MPLYLSGDSPKLSADSTGVITPSTAVTLSSQTTVEFSIPAWAKRISVLFSGVSLSGTDDILIQLGVSGSYSATYASTCAGIAGSGSNISTSTTGFVVRSAAAASITSGVMNVSNITGNVWIASFAGKQSTTAVQAGGGDVSLSGTATTIRLAATGANTFDAGTINIIYE